MPFFIFEMRFVKRDYNLQNLTYNQSVAYLKTQGKQGDFIGDLPGNTFS